MTEEIFDRVDENDEIIGETTKKEAHANGYAHRVSAVYVFLADGRLLVQKRTDGEGTMDHSAAGHLDKGESYDDAAGRELKEELGIDKPLRKVGVFYADERVPTRENNIVHYFCLYETILEPEGEKNIKLQKEEVAGIFPMTLSEIADNMRTNPSIFMTGFMFTINFYIKIKGLNIPLVKIR